MFIARAGFKGRSSSFAPTMLVLVAVTLAGCTQVKREDATNARAGIDAANHQFMDAFARGDAGAIATLYAEDGQLLPPGNQPVQGRTAIEKLWRGLLSLPVKGFQLTTTELIAHDDDAVEVGRYAIIGNDGRELDSGKYIVLWKRGAAGWRLYRDIWNSNAPVVSAPPTAPPDSTP
jgi:uncharacterized protein (TIGR02246 family)